MITLGIWAVVLFMLWFAVRPDRKTREYDNAVQIHLIGQLFTKLDVGKVTVHTIADSRGKLYFIVGQSSTEALKEYSRSFADAFMTDNGGDALNIYLDMMPDVLRNGVTFRDSDSRFFATPNIEGTGQVDLYIGCHRPTGYLLIVVKLNYANVA